MIGRDREDRPSPLSIVVLDNDRPGPPTAIGVPWNEESQRPNMTVAGLGANKANSIDTAHGKATISLDRKTISYSPAENFFGTDSFTYFVSDGEATNGVSLVPATVTVTVTPVNDAPVASADSAVTAEDPASPLSIVVLNNDRPGPDPTKFGAPWNEESQRPNMIVSSLKWGNIVDQNTITTEKGGTATVSPGDRKTILYQPRPDFFRHRLFHLLRFGR